MTENSDSFDFDSLLSDHIDALQELGNIGSGHAANALADLLNRRIDMSLPRFQKISTTEISTIKLGDRSPDSIFAVVILETQGEITLNTLIVFDDDTLKALIRIIRDLKEDIDISNLSSFDQSIISEVGNILALHFVTSINTFLGVKSMPKMPILIIEKSETILTSLATHYSEDFTDLLLIECDIFATDTKLKPLVILAPEPKSVEITLAKMFGA